MEHLIAAAWLTDIGRSLREAFFMFWETLWALVLGFALSGFVQSNVAKDAIQRRLGNHRPAAVAEASAYGMASTSCSYAASAMAKTLFQKGADLVSSVVFMVASTNLVVELGLVILVLLGWQFLVGEFVGGPLMIVALALLGGLVLRGPLVERARQSLQREDEHGEHHDSPENKPSWSAAASYAVADLKMLRRELVIGYVVAGFLAILVPLGWWEAVFLHGHGIWTVIENALVGPLVAMASFVCSIGNVPLAAALWHGGISFGGVIAFIFADLIALPLVLIYRKYYGGRLALRLVGLLYIVMVGAGLATQAIFSALNGLPPARTGVGITTARFAWNYTAYLDAVAILAAVFLYLLQRNRSGNGLATDPVCGMQVRTADAPARLGSGAELFYFCSDRCRDRFLSRSGR